MKTLTQKIIVTLVAAVGSSVALADNIAWPPPPQQPAGEVRTQQEIRQARVEFQKNPVVNGWRYVGGEAAWELQSVARAQGKTREQVLDELTAYRNDPQQRERHDRLYHSGA